MLALTAAFCLSGCADAPDPEDRPETPSNEWSGPSEDNGVMPPPAGLAFVGADLTTNSEWRTSGVAKPLDIDGDDIYGTEGWQLYGGADPQPSNQPAYVTMVRLAPAIFGGNGSYTGFDTTAGGGADLFCGTAYASPGAAPTDDDLFELTVDIAGSFRVGAFADHHDVATISPASFRLRQTVGGSADTGQQSAAADRDPERAGEDVRHDERVSALRGRSVHVQRERGE